MRHVLARLIKRMSARRPSDRIVVALDAAARSPRFEALEHRNLLSGNVTAVVTGTTLVITGDNEGNRIELTDGGGGAISVDASSNDASPTTINGAAGPGIFGGVTDIVIKLRGGNDEVTVDTVTLPGNLTILDNAGLDDVFLIDTNSAGNVLIKLGIESDYVEFSGTCAILGNVLVNTGGGNDAVVFHTLAGGDGPVTVAGRTTISLGNGDDNLTHFEEDGSEFNLFRVIAGNGSDDVELNGLNTTVGPIISLGNGDDVFEMNFGTILGKAKINLGNGNDTADVNNGFFDDDLNFFAGSGDDVVTFTGTVTLEQFRALFGTGDDEFVIVFEDDDMNQQAFASAGFFNGGFGDDEIDIADDPIFSNQPVIKNFLDTQVNP